MLRHVAHISRPRPSRFRRSPFEVRRRRSFHHESLRESAIDICATWSHSFHDLFQHVHVLTELPWALTIPATVLLTRIVTTPFRVVKTLKEKDRRLVIPKLRLAINTIEKQAQARVKSGIDDPQESVQWKQAQYELRKSELQSAYSGMTPGALDLSDSRMGFASLATTVVVFLNTSTIASLSTTIPNLIDLSTIGPFTPLLCVMNGILVVSNTAYYFGTDVPELLQKINTPVNTLKFWRWTEGEADALVLFFGPWLYSTALFFFPEAILLALISNSAYTFGERKLINRFIKLPTDPRRFGIRGTIQTTKTKR